MRRPDSHSPHADHDASGETAVLPAIGDAPRPTPEQPTHLDTPPPRGRSAHRPAPSTAPAPPPTVWLVIPVRDRPGDLRALLGDLRRLEAELATTDAPPARLRGVVVDNASREPIDPAAFALPPWIEVLRLETNRGGSGGFNAGLARALRDADDPPDLLWLLDSDARVRPETLGRLLSTLAAHPEAVAVGPAIEHPETIDQPEPHPRRVHELGGRLRRANGQFMPALARDAARDRREPIPCDYLAACCALVRAQGVREAGLLPDLFLNADDVTWFLRLARVTGGRVLGDPGARAAHPRFDRAPTWQRYYQARNACAPLSALPRAPIPAAIARFRRGLLETRRLVSQAIQDRPDLAHLHIAGLDDALAGRLTGPAPEDRLRTEAWRPYDELPEALRAVGVEPAPSLLAEAQRCATLDRDHAPGDWLGSGARLLLGPRERVACVPSVAGTHAWWRARVTVHCDPAGFILRQPSRARSIHAAFRFALAGLTRSARLALRPPPSVPNEPAPPRAGANLRVGAAVLSYNRREALERTLAALSAHPRLRDADIIVADNASTDGSPAMVAERFPGVRLVALERNLGVAGFNRAAELADADLLLILDDDAVPDPAALDAAAALLAERADLAAVALHPRHPVTGVSEWPFAADHPRADWPVMGCANLVRRKDWARAGGYAPGFFLYRNDTDLAMTLLAMGRGVWFDPSWVVHHDSPQAVTKSRLWFAHATRNWIWLARRHGRGVSKWGGALAGWAWAHKLARWDVGGHWTVLRAGVAGVCRRPPAMPAGVRPDGRAFRRLLRMQFDTRVRGRAVHPEPAREPHTNRGAGSPQIAAPDPKP